MRDSQPRTQSANYRRPRGATRTSSVAKGTGAHTKCQWRKPAVGLMAASLTSGLLSGYTYPNTTSSAHAVFPDPQLPSPSQDFPDPDFLVTSPSGTAAQLYSTNSNIGNTPTIAYDVTSGTSDPNGGTDAYPNPGSQVEAGGTGQIFAPSVKDVNGTYKLWLSVPGTGFTNPPRPARCLANAASSNPAGPPYFSTVAAICPPPGQPAGGRRSGRTNPDCARRGRSHLGAPAAPQSPVVHP